MARKKHKKEKVSQAIQSVAKKKQLVVIEPLTINLSIIILGVFLSASFLLYFLSLNFGFVLDDKIVLSENNFTKKGLEGIGQLLSTDSFQGYFGEQKEILQGGRYRPLSLISFAIEHQIFGLNAFVYHLNNIILYGLSVFIAFISLRLLFQEKSKTLKQIFVSMSFLACALFIIHPIHTEAVANIKGRDEILAFIFSMLSLYYSLKYFDKQRITSLVIMVAVFFLGLLAKENTITFLAVIPFSLLLFRSWNTNKSIKIIGSLLATTLIYFFIRIQALGYFWIDNPSTDIMNNPFIGLNTIERLSTIMFTLLTYLKLNFIPIALTHDYYPYHIPIMDLSDWQVWLSLIIHLGMVGAIVYFFKKNKLISYGLGFYLITLSIVSNIVVNVGTFMNERFVFMASLGLCLVIVQLLKNITSKIKIKQNNIIFLVLFITLFTAYGFKTIDRVPVWESELTLNQAAIKVSKNSARANSFMATAYFNRYKEITDSEEKKKLLELARPYAEKAIEIYPLYYNAHLMLSGISAEEYKYDRDINKLLENFKLSIQKRPDVDYLTTYLKYLNDRGNNIEELTAFYLDVGTRILYQEEKKYTWAIHYLLLADKLRPNNPKVRSALVQAYIAIGRNDLANMYR